MSIRYYTVKKSVAAGKEESYEVTVKAGETIDRAFGVETAGAGDKNIEIEIKHDDVPLVREKITLAQCGSTYDTALVFNRPVKSDGRIQGSITNNSTTDTTVYLTFAIAEAK